MGLQHASDRQSFFRMIEALSQGDCLEVDSFSVIADSSAQLLGAQERLFLPCAVRWAPWIRKSPAPDGGTGSKGRRKRAAIKAADPLPLTKACLIPLFRSGRAARSPRARPWQSWI